MKTRNTQRLVLTGLLTALVCVSTMVIKVPTPTNGYVNLGDTLVLVSGWLLGPAYGFFAAGVGSALADLLSGYTAYVPGTLMIKGFMAVLAYGLTAYGKGNRYVRGLSAFLAEVWMVLGYFMYESVVIGYGLAAAGSIFGNIMQGISGFVMSLCLYRMLEMSRLTERL